MIEDNNSRLFGFKAVQKQELARHRKFNWFKLINDTIFPHTVPIKRKPPQFFIIRRVIN